MLVENFMTYIQYLHFYGFVYTMFMHGLFVYSFPQSMQFAKFVNCFKYLFTNSFFFTVQLSSVEMCAVSFSLSLFSLPQLYSRWPTVWFPLTQGKLSQVFLI